MKKLAIPAILAATIMVAGAFAFMPVEQASTVHNSVIASLEETAQRVVENSPSQKIVAITYNLEGLPSNGVPIVLFDGTNVNNIESGHIVATLPTNAADGDCSADEIPMHEIGLLIGAVDNESGDDKTVNVTSFAESVGLGDGILCVFHFDINADELLAGDGLSGAGGVTDVAIVYNMPEPEDENDEVHEEYFPAGTSISVSLKLNNDVSAEASEGT